LSFHCHILAQRHEINKKLLLLPQKHNVSKDLLSSVILLPRLPWRCTVQAPLKRW